MSIRLSIGDFSRMTYLSVKALRHYHDMGDQTYGALGTFVAGREIGVQGPIKENYVVGFQHLDDESRHRTEVCWPVFHIRATAR